ncbi:hypothetical protein SAMN05445060_0429 [Williamsia sterculiae]|uniref:Uncharacterized protein n=1 Tax=Williamsia sterculiae TaxID=1344003 RepID=A0A1N7CXI5_9NOCA|nr:hypothetical protein SAMN05445060_0429 [Williamsia sterculiae]
MVYIFVIVGIAALGYLAWRAFGPQGIVGPDRDRDDRALTPRTGTRRQAQRPPIGPDDDPEFLWKLGRDRHPGPDDAPGASD